MERLILVVVLVAVAGVVAALVQRRGPEATPARTGYNVPDQVHRPDFPRPDADWLVAVFTSATCTSCAGVMAKAIHLGSDAVAVAEIEVTERKDLHDRYGIDGVPTLVVADRQGVVRRSFLGPVTATDLWAAVADLREPGVVPEGCHVHEPDEPA